MILATAGASAALSGLNAIRIVNMPLAVFVCIFAFYSFLGWFYECTVFSLGEQGKVINKGYFIGPWCPIYGVIMFLNIYLLSDVQSLLKVFLISAAVCTVIEYITSYTLEKLFDARYWDYTYYPMNINGRVSLPSSLFFGFVITFVFKIATPLCVQVLDKVPDQVLNIVAAVIVLAFLADAVITYICMQNLNRKCRQLYDDWNQYVDDRLEVLNEKKNNLDRYRVVRQGKNLLVKAKNVNALFVSLETRYLKNSGFRSTKYDELVQKMRFVLNNSGILQTGPKEGEQTSAEEEALKGKQDPEE